MADLDVFNVIGNVASATGGDFALLGIEDLAKDILASEVTNVSKLCKQAVRGWVPVDTKELRNSIEIQPRGKFNSRVFVPELTHEANPLGGFMARRAKTRYSSNVRISNSHLADILDEGWQRLSPPVSADFIRSRKRVTSSSQLMRSNNAIPDGPFAGPGAKEPTKSWIEYAQQSLVDYLAGMP